MTNEKVTPTIRQQILRSKATAGTLATRFGLTIEEILAIWEDES
jgi:hypothetical protein